MRVHKSSLIERLLYPYVRRIVAAYDDARRLTWKQCPSCKTPLVEQQANFCHICGTCLVPQLPAPQPVELQPISVLPVVQTMQEPAVVTDALYRLNLRPMNAFNEARRNGAGVKTAMTEAINLEKMRKNSK